MSVVGILGKKIGMTQLFDERGDIHPITVLKAGPCVITQLKTLAKDGYEAAQIGYVDFVKASKVNKAMTGHFAKSNVPPVRMIKEVALEAVKTVEGEEKVLAKAGDRILVDIFNDERFVDVIAPPRGVASQASFVATVSAAAPSHTVTCSRCRVRSALHPFRLACSLVSACLVTWATRRSQFATCVFAVSTSKTTSSWWKAQYPPA